MHHSSQPPPPGTDHYEMVDEGENREPLGAGVYEKESKQHTQTDGHTKHYQELDLANMERREYASIIEACMACACFLLSLFATD